MQQIARRNAVDVGKAAVCIGVKVETSNEVKQPAIGAVGNRHRQRRFVVDLDVGSDQTAEQSAQALLRRLAGAQVFKFLLEVFEGPQAVVLLRKPGMKVVHVSLFEWLKKLPAYTAGRDTPPRPFLHPRSASKERRHFGARPIGREPAIHNHDREHGFRAHRFAMPRNDAEGNPLLTLC
jgi:hypothetical protein